ncbi:hypothetical protein VB713_05010 [Anabaena cylindrica UHCC 0172]|uniref:hypothetical protein n=1 Tax=Anabaena cylindrica TaxID=1165 RepID=UPI002B221390|nr:hypothetical protein [Anabaena cylindrica]MEA5550346.1 hypothetical protein [Anabaena cylindrica UHCC 0172]
MNKYLMKTINYKEWKIEIYQFFARNRFEVMCYSPSGSKLDYSKTSMRCWFKEEFAIEEAQEFIDSIMTNKNSDPMPVTNWEYFELAKTQQVDLSQLAS